MSKTITNQELFDRVVTHLRGMSEPSFLDGSVDECAYRGANGAMCAVGCLISDTFYTVALEDLNAGEESVMEAVRASLGVLYMPEESMSLLQELQEVHDMQLHGLEGRASGIAHDFGLLYTPPKEETKQDE